MGRLLKLPTDGRKKLIKLRNSLGIIIGRFDDLVLALEALDDAIKAIEPKECKFSLEQDGKTTHEAYLRAEIEKK